MALTHIERERIAYASGLPIAPLLAELADVELWEKARDTAQVHIEEACSLLVAEDFLSDDIKALKRYAQGCGPRSLHCKNLMDIVRQLEDTQSREHQASEYARDELRQAQNALEDAA
jgi:hypothetical protein